MRRRKRSGTWIRGESRGDARGKKAGVCLVWDGPLFRSDYKRLQDAVEQAERLQAHNATLLGGIERTETRLLAAAEKATRDA